MSSPPDPFSIIVVDDDSSARKTLSDILELHGYAVSMFGSAAEAVSFVDGTETPPAVALVDLCLPDLDGLTLCSKLRERVSHLQVIVLTGNATLDSAVSAIRSGTADYLVKPVDPPMVLKAVELGKDRWRSSRVEAALLGNLERFRALIENLSEVVTVIDPDGRIVYESPAVKALLGYEVKQRLGQSYIDPVHDEDRKMLERCIDDGLHVRRNAHCTVRVRDASDRWKSVEISVNRVFNNPAVDGLVVTMVDVTERLRLETRVRQSEKMEAIGQLTGGLAHELNNLLAIIMANTQAVMIELPQESGSYQDIADAHEAAQRGARLIEKLLGFSRRERLSIRPTDLTDLMEHTAKLVRRTLPDNVQLTTSPCTDERCVAQVDTDAMAHIMVNLINNACDALSAGGAIEVRARPTTIDEAYAAANTGAVPGNYVELTVRDNGHGMEPHVLARVFEPFFSTKPLTHGTGLGMAMVYGLVKQMRGYVQASSRPGAGTTVHVYVPSSCQAAVPEKRHSSPHPGTSKRTGTILVVDDQKQLRRTIKRALERFGYTVVTAADGLEALQCIHRSTMSFDLLILDVVMPRMGGLELHQKLTERGINTPTLFTSGFTADDFQDGDLSETGLPLLRKPWTIEELSLAVEGAIRRGVQQKALVPN